VIREGTYHSPLGSLVVEAVGEGLNVRFNVSDEKNVTWVFNSEGVFSAFVVETGSVENRVVYVCKHISSLYVGEVFERNRFGLSYYVCPECLNVTPDPEELFVVSRGVWDKLLSKITICKGLT